ncbi:hypothetical protein BDW60DRAFT_134070 [Aspergillus nidulans var. acristatus]
MRRTRVKHLRFTATSQPTPTWILGLMQSCKAQALAFSSDTGSHPETLRGYGYSRLLGSGFVAVLSIIHQRRG